MTHIQNIITKTSEYLEIPATVGHEGPFMEYLAKDFRELGLNIYASERHLIVQGSEGTKSIITAHIDRHGLIGISPTEFAYAAQYVKEINYGEDNRLAAQEIINISNRFDGEKVVAYDSETGKIIGHGEIDFCERCSAGGDAIFRIKGLGDVPPNTPIAYARDGEHIDGHYKGQIDNTLSLGVIYELYKNGYQGTTIFACEEEIGKSWIHIAQALEDENVETRNLLVLDSSPFKVDSVPMENGHLILRNRDMSAEFNPELVSKLKQQCESLGIPYTVKDEYLLAEGKEIHQIGSTELGRLIKHTHGKYSGATIQVPTFMYHTSYETTTEKAIDNYYYFLKHILIDQA